jgi:hypothetical protein
MADDDYGRDIDPDEALATGEQQLKDSGDIPLKPANTDEPKGDTSGDLHTDPGDSVPAIPEDEEGRGEGDVADVTQPYTPEERMQHSMEQTRSARRSYDQLQARTAPMWEKYRQMAQDDQQARQHEGEDDQPYPPPPSHEKQTWMGAVTNLLAVAVPIAMMFGAKGNGFAKGAMMSALGSFMQNYTKGRDQAAKNDWTEWKEQVQAIHASNQQRHQIYKDILGNKRLALDDQFKMIHAVSSEFLDPTMMKAARTRDMKGVVKHLENQEKADSRFVRGADKTAKVLHPRDWQDYRQYIKDKTDGKVDPETDPVGADKVEKYTDWKDTESTAADRRRNHPAKDAKPKSPTADDVRKTLFGDQ